MSIKHSTRLMTFKTELNLFQMLLSSIAQTLLFNQDVPYRLVSANISENLKQTHASLSFLKDPQGIVMAIYNNNHQFDLSTLRALIERPELRFMSLEELGEALAFLKNTKMKPFNKGFSGTEYKNGIQLIIDEPMSSQSNVLLVTDNPAERIQVDIWDMQIMIENALIGGIFSHQYVSKKQTGNMKSNLLEQLKNIDHLPMMPTLAADLLKLQSNPDGTVDDMVRIISHDPALTVQILRYANSALFGFSGQINNLHDAIFRVLGYETVLYMSFGATLGRSFKLPQSGRLSMNNFWKEATYRAALCQQLALRMPVHSRPATSVAYITGLLHNIGQILMGSLFQTEFDWINKMLTSRPQQSLISTEQNLFDCTHASLGQYLMQHWNMPEEISAVVGEHHNVDYDGEQAVYVWLTQLAGQALAAHGLSDADDETISEKLCQQLELTEVDVEEALAKIMNENAVLDAMADTLCA